MMSDAFIYGTGNETSINVNIQDETVWLTRGRMTELFDKTRLVILELFNSTANYLEIPISHIENSGFPNFVEMVQ